ncbi:hypothetical protein [Telmatospirillum sp.]|uniref:hypothetical protein n=1 Tax=Telmatospirillum sp. TaxID=2079197 RepID=UPI0028428D81|nr:hypothetical protein [Telmatospirillum sp.]MDR3441378.1 hypothetical protein [Telmatospirillum sp.]
MGERTFGKLNHDLGRSVTGAIDETERRLTARESGHLMFVIHTHVRMPHIMSSATRLEGKATMTDGPNRRLQSAAKVFAVPDASDPSALERTVGEFAARMPPVWLARSR